MCDWCFFCFVLYTYAVSYFIFIACQYTAPAGCFVLYQLFTVSLNPDDNVCFTMTDQTFIRILVSNNMTILEFLLSINQINIKNGAATSLEKHKKYSIGNCMPILQLVNLICIFERVRDFCPLLQVLSYKSFSLNNRVKEYTRYKFPQQLTIAYQTTIRPLHSLTVYLNQLLDVSSNNIISQDSLTVTAIVCIIQDYSTRILLICLTIQYAINILICSCYPALDNRDNRRVLQLRTDARSIALRSDQQKDNVSIKGILSNIFFLC